MMGGVPKEVLIAKARQDLATLADKGMMIERLTGTLDRAEACFREAEHATGLMALSHLIQGFLLLVDAQRIPAQYELEQTRKVVKELTESLNRAGSPIIQPGLVAPADAASRR